MFELIYLGLSWTAMAWLAGYFMGVAVGLKKRE